MNELGMTLLYGTSFACACGYVGDGATLLEHLIAKHDHGQSLRERLAISEASAQTVDAAASTYLDALREIEERTRNLRLNANKTVNRIALRALAARPPKTTENER